MVGCMVPTILNPIAAFWFLFQGKMDQYTSTIMLHGGLLVNAPQFLHLLKFQRRSSHRWAFIANTSLLSIHFGISFWANLRGIQNLNFCPELQDAIATFRRQRIAYTAAPLAANKILTMADYAVSRIDKYRNAKPIDRNNGEHSRRTRPAWLTWNSTDPWDLRRVIYCFIASSWFIYSIYQLEFFIIRGFHSYIRDLDGVSSLENNWAIGQVSSFLVSCVIGVYNIGGYVKQKVETSKRRYDPAFGSHDPLGRPMRPERPKSTICSFRRMCSIEIPR
jgi:hypothetical protein